jgi:uncharacterized protein YuzE
MVVTVGEIQFDNVRYDREGDVLYLHVGSPSSAVDFDGSPEGHHVRFDGEGRLVGITIVDARRLLEDEGRIVVTLQDRQLEVTDLSDVLAAA